MEDMYISLISLSQLVAFIVTQIIVHRIYKRSDVISLLKKSYMISLSSIFVIGLIQIVYYQSFSLMNIVMIIIAICIGSLWIIDYITGIFGLPTASLRIRQLTDITATGSKGLTHRELLKIYGKEEMVRIRLERLTSSGEISRMSEKYYPSNKITYFWVHAVLINMLRRIYLGKT